MTENLLRIVLSQRGGGKDLEECGNLNSSHVSNFWKVWHSTVTHRTVNVTNPPFVKDWLEPFVQFLTISDNPSFILLQNKAPDGLYFERHLFDRIQRKSELNIFHFQKSFCMKQKGGILAGFSGLTLCCYFPKQWKFDHDREEVSTTN